MCEYMLTHTGILCNRTPLSYTGYNYTPAGDLCVIRYYTLSFGLQTK